MVEVVLRDLAAESAPAWSELKKWKPTRTRARLTSLTTSLSRSYSRVVPVIRLSSEKCTLSVPKKARSALVTAPLWQAWAEGYSGKFGVAPSGFQVGSASVFGFPSVSASGIAWYGRQNQ